MSYLNSVAAEFAQAARFIFVYIAEAHAQDEWPISQLDKEIMRHKTIDDRRAAADAFLEVFPLHQAFDVVLDDMEDTFNSVFASWPFRYWVLVEGRLELKPQPRDACYDVEELGRWLREHCKIAGH